MRASRVRLLVIACAMLLAATLSACGSSHRGSARHASTEAAVANAPATTAAPAAPPPAPHLRIVSPRPQARVVPTLSIRVSLTGAPAAGPQSLRYVLDGSLIRLGSERLTFHGLVPGEHHLVVKLASRPAISTRVSFIVLAPAAPSPPPAPIATQTASAPPPQPSTPPPSAPQPPAPAPTPPPSGGIPQGANAGDGDIDNHGGPTDGDGNL